MGKIISFIIFALIMIVEFSGSSALNQFNNYALILLPFFAIIYQFTKREKKLKINLKNTSMIFLILFLVYIIGSLLYTYDFDETLKYVLQFSCIIIFSLFCYRDLSFWNKLKNTLFIISSIVAVSVIVTSIYPNFLINHFHFLLPKYSASLQMYYSELRLGIYSGILFERAYTAFALNLGIAAFLSDYFSNNKIKKSQLFGILLILIALFCTGKRTLFLIPIVSFVILCLLNNKNKKMLINIVKLIPVFIILGIVIINYFPSASKVFERFVSSSSKSTMDTRKDGFWSYAIEIYKEKPIIGSGIGTFKSYISTLRNDHVYDAHNIYIQLLAENGTVGFILMMIVFISNYLNIIKLLKKAKSKEEIIIANFSVCIQTLFLIYGLTGNPLYYVSQFLIYVLTIPMNISLTTRKEEINEKNRNYNIS